MRYRFDPVDKTSRPRLFESLDGLDQAGDLVAALLMPVYLGVVGTIAWVQGFSIVSILVFAAVALNCWPASRGLRRLVAARRR